MFLNSYSFEDILRSSLRVLHANNASWVTAKTFSGSPVFCQKKSPAPHTEITWQTSKSQDFIFLINSLTDIDNTVATVVIIFSFHIAQVLCPKNMPEDHLPLPLPREEMLQAASRKYKWHIICIALKARVSWQVYQKIWKGRRGHAVLSAAASST